MHHRWMLWQLGQVRPQAGIGTKPTQASRRPSARELAPACAVRLGDH